MPGKIERLTTNNYILNTLPDADYQTLLPHLEKVDLPLGKQIYLPDGPIDHVYFPDNSMISVVTNTSDGQSLESWMIGREGMACVEVLMGVDSSSNESMVQIPDGGHRVTTAAIRSEFARGGALHKLALRYVHALLMQVSQTALCNRLHSLEHRLARWLLMCRDRSAQEVMKLTQEFLATMLGVSRPTVTIAANALQARGYIKYSRGRITITDGPGLEKFTCECYKAVKKIWPPPSI